MANLQDLVNDPGRQAVEEALYQRALADIEKNAMAEAQRLGEGYFGRGMGLSSIHAGYQADLAGAKAKALEKARTDAFLASQQMALQARAQQAQELQATQTLGQRQAEAKQAGAQANKNMWMQAGAGLGGAALGAAGKVFGPALGDLAKSWLKPSVPMAGGAAPMPGAMGTENYGDIGGAAGAPPIAPGAITGPEVTLPDLGASTPGYDFGESLPSFDLGSSLPSFDVGDIGGMDWTSLAQFLSPEDYNYTWT